jgi:RNA polymerase sigma factor (sigma-70 family)
MKMETDDRDLLRQYAERHPQEAFATLVGRHVNLVYSVALRRVGSSHLAEEVSQSVFMDLARNADKLRPDTVLGAWLHSVAYRTAIDVVRGESRRQVREQQAMEMAAMDSVSSDWSLIEGLLDEGMDALDETDRSVIVLRYFENKSLREVGATLGTSDDAAQKRVSRAVERLREFFTKRGVIVGASGLAVGISANAVQAAPAGLAAAISTAAALAGTTVAATTTTATITKAIAMTALQKTLIVATLTATVGAGIYQAHQASVLRNQVQALQEEQSEQIQRLQNERDTDTRQLAASRDDNARLNNKAAELQGVLPRLSTSRQSAPGKANTTTNDPYADLLERMANDPDFKKEMREINERVAKFRYGPLFKDLNLTPEQQDALVGLRVDQELLVQEKNTALLKGGDLAELQNEVAAAREKFDAERKTLLGADGFQQFKDYENTYPDRLTVDSFKADQEAKNPLSDDQASQLLKVMTEERARNPYLSNRDDAENVLKPFDAESGERFLQAQEQVNQQILSRAAAFLSPPQIQALADDQAGTLASQKKEFEKEQRLFGGKTN